MTAQATCTNEPLWLHCGVTLTTDRGLLMVEVERVLRPVVEVMFWW